MREYKIEEPLLYYEVHGTQGPHLLLVHGILSSRVQWMPNLEGLTAFCRPVIVELLGHGRSPAPDDPECYTPDRYVLEFESIREKLGVDRWFVCGQSLGAALTLRYGLNHPDHIIAQVFTNSRSALAENRPEEGMKKVAKRVEERGRKVLEEFPLLPSPNRHLDFKIKKALIDDLNLINLQGLSYNLQYLVTRCSVHKMIHENQVPTLLIVGKFDKQFSPLVSFAEKTIPNLEILVCDGGHAVNIDADEQFNEAVRDFISRFLGGPPTGTEIKSPAKMVVKMCGKKED
jgi:2-succinyl-6-hydroxy-2,4-cyclohexadiene-1-carboxylate synthase